MTITKKNQTKKECKTLTLTKNINSKGHHKIDNGKVKHEL